MFTSEEQQAIRGQLVGRGCSATVDDCGPTRTLQEYEALFRNQIKFGCAYDVTK